MKIKYTGKTEITLRGVTFPPKKPVEVKDASLARKVLNMPDFEEVKGKK